MKHLAFVLLALSRVATASSLDDRVAAILCATQAVPDTGVAVAIVHRGKLLLSRGYGLRDREAGLPATEKTLFAIGSTTKAFTGMTLAIAEKEGLLSLDRPVVSYLRDFMMKDPKATSEMTAIDLMSHRSGLPRHDLVWYLTPFTRENLVYRLRYLEPTPSIPFRTGYQYNNLMFMTAGYLLEKVAGRSWEAYARSKIFEPLGMTDTTAVLAEAKKASELAQPYVGTKRVAHKDLGSIAPAGAIYSSVSDLARWVQLHLRRGTTEAGVEILPQKIFEKLVTPHVDVKLVGIRGKYGLGWMMNRLHGRKYVWHNGNIDGFSAHVSLLPDAAIGIVVLMNQNGEKAINFDIPARIYEAVLGEPPSDASLEDEMPRSVPRETLDALFGSADLERRLSDTKPEPAPEALRAYEGLYLDPGYGEMHIFESEGQLKAHYYGHTMKLTQTKGDEFAAHLALTWTSVDFPFAFQREHGEVTALAVPLESSVHAVRFRRALKLR